MKNQLLKKKEKISAVEDLDDSYSQAILLVKKIKQNPKEMDQFIIGRAVTEPLLKIKEKELVAFIEWMIQNNIKRFVVAPTDELGDTAAAYMDNILDDYPVIQYFGEDLRAFLYNAKFKVLVLAMIADVDIEFFYLTPKGEDGRFLDWIESQVR